MGPDGTLTGGCRRPPSQGPEGARMCTRVKVLEQPTRLHACHGPQNAVSTARIKHREAQGASSQPVPAPSLVRWQTRAARCFVGTGQKGRLHAGGDRWVSFV